MRGSEVVVILQTVEGIIQEGTNIDRAHINPPLKDGLLGSFRLESQMYCSLAQGVVLNGMFFALGLYFSSPNGVIGPAWPDILGGAERTYAGGGGDPYHVFSSLSFGTVP